MRDFVAEAMMQETCAAGGRAVCRSPSGARTQRAAKDVEYGTVYRWQPESVVVGCGEETSLTHSETACEECGAEHKGLVRGDLSDRQPPDDEYIHP